MKVQKLLLVMFLIIALVAMVGCKPEVIPTAELTDAPTEVPVATATEAGYPVVTPTEAAYPAVEKTAKELQNGVPFRYVGNGIEHPVIRIMMLGFLEACKDNDVLCEYHVGSGFEDSAYLEKLDQAIALGSTGMLVSSYGPHRPLAIEGMKQGIPMVSFHTPLVEGEMEGLLAWVATDVTDYAQRTAVAMAEKLQCTGPIALTQNTFNDVENEASRAFTEKMKELCPTVEVLAPDIEGGDAPAAIAKVSAILLAHPDLKGAYGTTGGSATSWGKAVEQAGKQPGEIVIIGMDYTRENLDLVKAGWVYALVGQPIYEETYRCVELLVANLKGEKVEFSNTYPSPIITIDDVDTYYGYADRVTELLGK